MPSPYMMDLFEAIHADQRFCLHVVFLEKPAVAAPGVYWQERALPSYATVLPGGWFLFRGARVHLNYGLLAAISKSWPDIVVVMGYNSITCQLAMYWLSVLRFPWIFWGESPGFERRGKIGRMLRWLALRPVATLANGIAAIGSRAVEAYSQLSNIGRPVCNIPYYCRNDKLMLIHRPQANVNEGAHFLYCGQIISRKGVDLLLRAFCRVALDDKSVRLTLVGDGPLREAWSASVPPAIRDRVTWAGFKEAHELTPYFAAANVFVLPSLHDGWGVVINQAVSAGMAVIASDAVGAAVDLVKHRQTGLIFPAEDEEMLTASLRHFVNHPEDINRFGQASREMAREISPERGADRWYQFCLEILDRRGKSSVRKAASCACS